MTTSPARRAFDYAPSIAERCASRRSLIVSESACLRVRGDGTRSPAAIEAAFRILRHAAGIVAIVHPERWTDIQPTLSRARVLQDCHAITIQCDSCGTSTRPEWIETIGSPLADYQQDLCPRCTIPF